MHTPKIIKLEIEEDICPYPLIKTIKKAEEIKEDLELGKKILEVTTGCFAAIENIPTEFQKRGFGAELKKIGLAKWKIIIKGPVKKSFI